MKGKKNIGKIVFGVICAIIVIICICIQVILGNDKEKLQTENEKLETLVVQTKSGKNIETEYTHVEENKFFIKVPKNFKQLDYDTITKKYIGDIPDVVFSNEETTINIAISITENTMENNQIKSYKEYMETILKNTSEVVSSNYYEIDNHNIGNIVLISKASDTDIYNNMIFFSYNDKLVIVTFNCTVDLREEWQSVAEFVIDSLFFN